jgi:ATP/maltotriose-dependent transcriptional regulator MalT/DNA-binding SARP family transcriptional activator
MSMTSPGAMDARSEASGRSILRSRLAARLTAALDEGSVILTAGGGCGKTTVLDQALREAPAVAWLNCSPAERAPGTLLLRIVDAIAEATPGASDALAERLNVGVERVDALAAIRELIGELSKLLVEPLVLAFDDAEHLDGAEGSLRLLGELIRAEVPLLHVAVASRRALDLRVAKPKAAGRLAELGTADLTFDAEECTMLLRERSGSEPSPEQVDEVMRATEGWPLGIALAAGLVGSGRDGADGRAPLTSLGSAPDLRAYLSEELLDSLDPELRNAAVRSSVAAVITSEVALALELPEDFENRAERAGVLLRRLDGGDAFAYHPLLRDFLLERLEAESGGEELRRLHATVAPALMEAGDGIAAIQHWLEAERWPEAVAAIEREGPMLLRTSPELLQLWLAQLPEDVRGLPVIRTLEGQLEWGAGQHEHAAVPLREAVSGYREAGDTEREWLARYFLAEALFSAGDFDEMCELAEGWDADGSPASTSRAGVAWYRVLAVTAQGRVEEGRSLAAPLRQESMTAAQFKYLDDLSLLMVDLAAGGAEEALVRLRETIRELELRDPQGRLPVALAVIALVHLDLGHVPEALEWLVRCQRESERLGLAFIARDAHLQRASLLAKRGELAAELELEQAGSRQGTGWRGVSRPVAEANVAAARGDAPEAVAAAQRALDRVRPGLICYRVWAALDMACVLADSGSPDRARRAIDEARAALDEAFPGEMGRYHRARLLATEAWLDYDAGDRDSAYENLKSCWAEAGAGARHVARAHWRRIKPVLWQALAEGAIDTAAVLPSLADALPGGEALIDFTDHPESSVRAAAVPAALAANHPTALFQLDELLEDPDERVAASAAATVDRLRRAPPPLRFKLLGGFRASRGQWELPEDAWGRPIDARLVRFLLTQAERPVSEDLIFEALWPGLSASSARRSLQVSVSRIRAVLDPPSVETSAIQSAERAYRLVLADRDVVDADEFLRAAAAALAERGEARAKLLTRARSLWGGEPLAEERYSDWAAGYRERLTDRQISVLTALIELNEATDGPFGTADAARELVDLDPLNEEGHRALMTAYARSGRRGHALRQFLECRRALVDALGVEPADATSRLQARILAGDSV